MNYYSMERIVIVFALVVASTLTSAQNIQGSYQPKAGGQIKKNVCYLCMC